jgi:two-component system chemotaxis response regulator CheB
VLGSHGGLEASQVILGCLPRSFPATVFVDLHRGNAPGRALRLLARDTAIPVRDAYGGLAHRPGIVYVAPADRSVLITQKEFVDVHGCGRASSWHRFVDLMLTNAAQAFGPRLVAIILSGHLDGGAIGIRVVKTHGGRVLIQAPETARAPSMPSAAMSSGCVDFALPPELLGRAMVALCAAPGAAELFRVRPVSAVAS